MVVSLPLLEMTEVGLLEMMVVILPSLILLDHLLVIEVAVVADGQAEVVKMVDLVVVPVVVLVIQQMEVQQQTLQLIRVLPNMEMAVVMERIVVDMPEVAVVVQVLLEVLDQQVPQA